MFELAADISSGLGALTSLVAGLLPTPGKLTIIPFDAETSLPIGAPYVAMFNPETFTSKTDYEYDTTQAQGEKAVDPKFKRIKPQEFSVDLLIDGTGASGEQREVMSDVALFTNVMKFRGDKHEPPSFIVIWGPMILRCKSAGYEITYTLFRANGTPLRATIKARFMESTPILESLITSALSSPDLTHVWQATEADKLPLLTYKIYNDSRFYLEVARVNKLTNFRQLKAGQLVFPPLDKDNT